MRPSELRRLRGEADAVWRAAVAGEVERVLAVPDPAQRMAAYAELSRVLAGEGEALPPSAADRIFRSLRLDAEAVEREARRRRWEAERATQLRLDRLRSWALWLGVPFAAGLPPAAALAIGDWPLLGVPAVALEAPRLPRLPVLGIVAALSGVCFAWWFAAGAEGVRALRAAVAGAFAAGVLAVAAAQSLPVHVADRGARLADGSGLGSSVVRVERLWPARPDRLHVLLGNGRVGRRQILELRGGQPERYLRGQ